MEYLNRKTYSKYDVINFDYLKIDYSSGSKLIREFQDFMDEKNHNKLCIYFKGIEIVDFKYLFSFAKKVKESGIEKVAVIDPSGKVKLGLLSHRDFKGLFRFISSPKEI